MRDTLIFLLSLLIFFSILLLFSFFFFFFFNDTATTEIYTLSLHDALPISGAEYMFAPNWSAKLEYNYLDFGKSTLQYVGDRKSTRLNSSHTVISYAVFCLKKKKKKKKKKYKSKKYKKKLKNNSNKTEKILQ